MSTAAAIDCGTNSVRLLVARSAEHWLEWLDRDAVVTRLGAGVAGSGRLDDDAMARTVEVVAGYAERARAADASAIRVVATSAARDAANTDRFVSAVEDRVGLTPEILTGAAEAALAFAGAVGGADPPRPTLVLDIGGGSTEFVLGDDAPIAVTSRQIGVVRLTEQALAEDPPAAAGIALARALIDAELDAARDEVDIGAARSLVAVAGTATTLAGLHLGLAAYDARAIHGTVLTAGDVSALVQELGRLPARDIRRRGPVAPGREDVLLAGALLLERTANVFGFDRVIVSECDLLDGICLQLLADHPPG